MKKALGKNMTNKITEEDIARICHEANRIWCEMNDDYSQPSWFSAPDWQKESTHNGVRFHLNNPDAGPEASHENWLELKIKEGWKYSEVKDVDAKLHPCLLPFEQLPLHQQAKDKLFRNIVHSLRDMV